MHASEANRRSHRRRPELNINTSPLRSRSHDARPSTPPSIRRPPVPPKGKPPVSNHRALRMQQPPSVSSSTSSRDYDDTFFDSLSSPLDTAMDNKENEHEHATDRHGKNNALRDSHDLSLSPRQITRDSLVANMLMSLDQFSLGQIHTPSTPAAPFDEPGHSNYRSMSLGGDDPTRTISSVARPGRMHSAYQPGHSYTYSSDYEGDDLSSQYSRSRRSNSSSGFQANLGRLHSMRETTSPRGPSTSGGRPLHSRGGKTSKNSSLNSFDGGYAQVLGSQRWAHGLGGRSSSFDMGQGQKPSLGSLTLPTNGGVGGGGYGSHSAFNLEFTNTLWTEDYEAAPTPTVPGGPRRPTLTSAPATAIPSPAIPSQHHYPHPDHAETDHKVPTAPNSDRLMSMRSSRSATAGRAAANSARYDMPQPPVPLPPNDTAIADDDDDDVMDDDMEDSAPSPHIGYEKTTKEKEKEKALPPPGSSQQPPPAQQPAKERPGFFRRVFGSSKTLASAFDTNSTSPHVSPTTVETQARPGSKQQAPSSQQKPASTPPSRDSQQPSAFTGQHVIQKKSSFFRRRKKSIAEPLPPVPRPPSEHMSRPGLGVEPARMPDKPDPSPVSSLRQVMNPYLRSDSGGSSSLGLLGPRQERGNVSPQYDVEDREEDRRRKTGRGFSPEYEPGPKATIRTVKSQSALFTRNREPMGLGASKRTPVESPPMPTERPKLTRDTTFFEDSSDTDADKATPLPPDELYNSTPRPSPSPRPGASKDDARGQRGRSQGEMGPDDGFYKAEVSPGLEPVASNEADTRPSSLGLPIQDQDPARPTSLGLPIQDQHSSARGSVSTDNGADHPADALPSFTVDSAEASPKQGGSPLDEPEVTIGEPTEDDRQKAQRIFDGNEDFIQKSRAAAWMGEEGPVRQRTLQAYMELYDFADKSVLTCLREVCGRLILRAETQQVDRILVGFSKRWCDCNPHHGFKALDVIHTLCYSIMLLNTDLHLADIESKMTRSQFVKNTMTTIVQALEDYVPDAFERPSILPGKNPHLNPADPDGRAPPEPEKINWRASFLQPRSDSRLGDNGDGPDACGPLVKSPFYGSMRAWEGQMETVLKDIYTSIRDDKLPLFGGATEQNPPSSNSLSVLNVLSRTPSVLSKAPSEQQSMRGRMDGVNRPPGSRWTSKSRSRPRLGTAGFSSSRTSFDDENSIWSPTMSSATWSRYSLGRTQTSPSVDSLGSALHRGDYQQSIGFANALSHAIIREDGGPLTTSQSYMSGDGHGAELEDESLELYGSPWAKEGLVVHKHHVDGSGKKAKDRNWSEVFAVVQKGTMTLFSFSAKSMRNKGRSGRKQSAPGGVVGGGNWQENATGLGSFSLQQTMASALPAPGYSRTRPHVWALSLPNGAIHLFQVGTPEIGKEFIDTVTYWSARLSTHPLVGGISNIEYGWSDACINNALVSAINDNAPPPRPGSAAAAGRQSMHSRSGSRQSSLRSSFDMGTSGNRLKLPGDRIHIADWSPPASSLRPSHCSEVEQLETLIAYVRGIEDELQQHNQLRSPMLLAFTPRGSNATKAMANWERKSDYLLREIVKFQTYVDGLQYAQKRRKEIEDEREVAHRAARGDEVLDDEDNLGEARLAANE